MASNHLNDAPRRSRKHEKVPLPRSERYRPRNSRLIGVMDPENEVHLHVVVRRRPDAPVVPDLAYWQKIPLHERQFVSPKEYRDKYGAVQVDMTVVSEFLLQHRMRILEENLGTRTISVLCTAAQIQDAFEVQLNRYETVFPRPKSFKTGHSGDGQVDLEPHIHHGFDGKVHIPAALKGILTAVVGLDDRALFHGGPGLDPSGATSITVDQAVSLYNFPTIDTSDQTMGIISCTGGYLASDIASYFTGKTAPTVVDISLFADGSTWANSSSLVTSINSTNINQAKFGPVIETTCDIQVAGTVARGCTINMYFTTNSEMGWKVFLDRILQPQGEKQPAIVSCSWTLELMDDRPVRSGTNSAGFTNFSVLSSLFQDLANAGVSVFTDTGDWGADDLADTSAATGITPDGLAHVGYPSSDPWVTAVGGTIIAASASPSRFEETAWSDMVSGSFTGASGGGCSTLFGTTPPDYQVAAGITQRSDSNGRIVKGRFTPDISGMVAYTGFILNAGNWRFVGTSFSTPLNAGLFAVLGSSFGRGFGHLNSVIYPFGIQSDSPFNNVTAGNNNSGRAAPLLNAPFYDTADTLGTGGTFDLVTGWGSVDGLKMQNKLASVLYPRGAYFAIAKNTFSKNEVGIGASFPNAFWVVLEGFTALDPVGTPEITCSLVAAGTGINISIGTRQVESKLQPGTPQRILWPCEINFAATSATIFPAAAAMMATFPLLTGVSCLGEIELVLGADPYFQNIASDGTTPWYLSQDLRVFTVTPGVNKVPITTAMVPGAPFLNPASNTSVDGTAGYQYCQDLITWLTNGFSDPNGPDPFLLLPNQGNALTADSSVSPTSFNARSNNFFTNYNFALARVRVSESTGLDTVKVFFRLFTSQSPDTDYNESTTYPTTAGQPVVGSFNSTIPFFSSGNYGHNTDYTGTSVNNKTIVDPTSSNKWVYFGCFLNIFDLGNKIGPMPIQSILTGTHHCLVAEISFKDTPIVVISGQTPAPSNSDKLAQRNLQVTFSDNPGGPETHLVPQTFDLRPSFATTASPVKSRERPDELQIEWGNTAPGSVASIYWPQASVPDVLALSKQLYATHQLSASPSEPGTIQCTIPPEGFTYIPIPFASSPDAENLAGLITIQLPQGIVQGQEFLITVRRLVTRKVQKLFALPFQPGQGGAEAVQPTHTWRYVTGSFAIRIPVSVPAEIVPLERDIQSITAWRLNQLKPSDRWYSVLQKYLKLVNARLEGLTGENMPFVPSPIGVAGSSSGDGEHQCHCHCHGRKGLCRECDHGGKDNARMGCTCECHREESTCDDCACSV